MTTDLLRRYGRGPRAARVRDHTPGGHWQTHMVIAALRLEGLQASAVFEGPIDNRSFLAYVEQTLVATLRPGRRGGARQSCRTQTNGGARRDRTRRRTAPTSIRIELAFAKLKAFMRAARPRSFEQDCTLVATALGFYTTTECANYLRHCGYRLATTL
jgi:hypothetical protein